MTSYGTKLAVTLSYCCHNDFIIPSAIYINSRKAGQLIKTKNSKSVTYNMTNNSPKTS